MSENKMSLCEGLEPCPRCGCEKTILWEEKDKCQYTCAHCGLGADSPFFSNFLLAALYWNNEVYLTQELRRNS